MGLAQSEFDDPLSAGLTSFEKKKKRIKKRKNKKRKKLSKHHQALKETLISFIDKFCDDENDSKEIRELRELGKKLKETQNELLP